MDCRIVVRGHLDPTWAGQLGGLRVTHDPSGTSLLAGPLPDQAALHGVLLQITRLGLSLLAVEADESAPRDDADTRGTHGHPDAR